MARLGKNITDAELAVLEVLWEQGPATIRQITEVLYPKGTTAHYATVQKLLERLEAKKYIQRNREGPALAHLFLASIDRDALISRQLQSMAEKLCGGSLTPILTHLVRAQRLSPQEIRSLRSLIDSLETGPKAKAKKR